MLQKDLLNQQKAWKQTDLLYMNLVYNHSGILNHFIGQRNYKPVNDTGTVVGSFEKINLEFYLR